MAKKRKDGRYQKSFMYDGKRYYVYASTKGEFTEKINEKIKELEKAKFETRNPILDDYYDEFTRLRTGTVKESTIRTQKKWYKRLSDVILGDKRLGDYRIADITNKDIKLVQTLLNEEGKLKSGTINDYIHHLSHVLSEAVAEKLVEDNPCGSTKPMKRKEDEIPARETIHRALSEDETKLFFQGVAETESHYSNLYKLLLQTGVRVSEAGALSYKDMNLKDGFLEIKKTISRRRDSTYYVSQLPKTDCSNRRIMLNSSIQSIIESQKLFNRAFFGMKFNDRLFYSTEGLLLRDETVNKDIKAICALKGIEIFTCHAFRATFATRFLEQRAYDFKALQEILGHSSIEITLELYAHVMQSTKQKAMQEIVISM